MILIDANILLYAYNADAPEHDKARDYVEAQLSGVEPFALSWQVITAFFAHLDEQPFFSKSVCAAASNRNC